MKSIFRIIIPLFLVHISFAQTFNWGFSQGGNGIESSTCITEDGQGNVFLIGSFSGTVDFDPGINIFNLTSVGESDIFIQKLDTSGNFIWAISFGSINDDSACKIDIDSSNNIILTGFYCNTIDFNPGPGVNNLTSSGSSDIFILKLTSDGEYIWAKSIGGAGSDNIYDLVQDSTGNLYLYGYFYGTIDCDPGVGIFNLSSHGQQDVIIEKLDDSGNFIWAKSIGGIAYDQPGNLVIDHFGNIFVNGSFEGVMDINTGPDTFNVSSNGYNDIFVLKLDNSGEYLWSKTIGGTSFDSGTTMTIDENSSIYISGSFFGTYVNFNPGTNTPAYLHSAGGGDIYIAKITTNGEFQWAKSIGSIGSQFPFSIIYNTSGFLYLTGSFEGTVDFNTGLATTYLTSAGGPDHFIEKIDTSGNSIWAFRIGSSGLDGGIIAFADNVGNVYAAGDFYNSTLDIDPTEGNYMVTSAGSYDTYFIKLSQGLCSDFTIRVDSLSNISCTNPGYASVYPIYAANPVNYVWDAPGANNTNEINFNETGIFTVSASDANNCFTTSSVIINGPNSYSNFDLNANLISTNLRTGDPADLWIDAFNDGCIPTSGTLTLILDEMTTYVSSNPTPIYVNADTLSWNFNNLTYDSVHFIPSIKISTSQFAMIGDTLCFSLLISPVNDDFNPGNNTKHICLPVLSAYDPNDKKVYPSGVCDEHYILNEQKLSYTVRFQNTGNAEAYNIYVLDSISPFLDVQSLRVVSSSHPVIPEFLQGNLVKFRFNNIHLADSTTNEPESHGYIVYEIDPVENLPDGSVINNKAAIYFDYNPAVITNSVMNTIMNCQNTPFDFSLSTTSICLNDTIFGAFEESGFCFDYTWSIDSTLSHETIVNIIPTNSGTFNLIINRNNGLCFNDSVIPIVVHSLPLVTLDSFEPDTICEYLNQITLPNGFPVGGIYSGNGVNGSILNTNLAGVGNHLVVYTFTDLNGCMNESTAQITVESCLNTENLSDTFMQIYPNPFHNKLFVRTIDKKACVLHIYNPLHQLIKDYIIPGNETFYELDTEEIMNGIYLIVLETDKCLDTMVMVKN